MDVVLCLRVFIRYISGKDICCQNDDITDYIKKLTPIGYDLDSNCQKKEDISQVISKGGKSKKRKINKKRKTKRKPKKHRKTKSKR